MPLGYELMKNSPDFAGHIVASSPEALNPKLGLHAGDILYLDTEKIFMVTGFSFISLSNSMCQNQMENMPEISIKKFFCPLIMALKDICVSNFNGSLDARKEGWSLGVITLSDKGYCGKREDLAGSMIIDMIKSRLKISAMSYYIIPDDLLILKSLLADLAWMQNLDIIITTGGTGLGSRDITPQATSQMLDFNLPGIEQAMMQTALTKTCNAMLSRARVGIAAQSLIINLPGSPKAVAENLSAILPALEHGLLKLHGDMTDCAR